MEQIEQREQKAQKSSNPLHPLNLLTILCLLAFGLRAGTLTAQSLWRDEVDALCYSFQFPHAVAQALLPAWAGELHTPCACPPAPPVEAAGEATVLQRLSQVAGPMIHQNGPLYFFWLRGWIGLAGVSEYALRFFSTWFGVLTVALTYALGRRLLGRAPGALAALLTALSPYLVWYSQEVKMYTLLPALALLAVYALQRAAVGGERGWWAVQVIATSLAFYTHVWSALLLPVQALLLVTWWPRWRAHWHGALVSLALLSLPYLPLALWQIPGAFVVRETGFPRETLVRMALILLNGWSTGISGRALVSGAALCGGSALLGLTWRPVAPAPVDRWHRLTAMAGLVGWIAIPLIGIWFVSLWQPLFTDRYLIWTAPAFYLLAGAGLAALWRRLRYDALLPLAAILIIGSANLYAQASTPIKPDMRAAARYVEAAYRPGDLLIFQIPHLRYTFDYYFGPADYAWVDGLFTNHRTEDGGYRMTEEEASAQMTQMTEGHSTVWLVASETEMWDERHLVERWLVVHGQREAEAHFVLVDVTGYRLAEGRVTADGRAGCTAVRPAAADTPWELKSARR